MKCALSQSKYLKDSFVKQNKIFGGSQFSYFVVPAWGTQFRHEGNDVLRIALYNKYSSDKVNKNNWNLYTHASREFRLQFVVWSTQYPVYLWFLVEF